MTHLLKRRLTPGAHHWAQRPQQRGLTLLETLIAMVVTSTILLPTMGFITLTMGEQATARLLNAETSNIAAVNVAMVRDVSNAKAVAAAVDASGIPQTIDDCPGGPGSGGTVVLALITSQNQRVVYSLEGATPPVGGNLWRRVCPNQNNVSGTPLSDPLLQVSPPVANNTTGAIIGQRIESAASSCPKGDGTQSAACREVTLRLQGAGTSGGGNERAAVVVQATRRNDTYAVLNTPPIARFSYAPSKVADEDTVTFDATGSRDPRGGTLTYQWSFSNPVNKNVPASPAPPNPPSGFVASATTDQQIPPRTVDEVINPMTATLTVHSSESGLTNSITQNVNIGAKAPTATLTPIPPIVVKRDTPVQFVPTLTTYSKATIAQTTMEWGDTTANTENFCPASPSPCVKALTHSFPNMGNFNVKVTVVDSNGKKAVAAVSVKVETDIIYVSDTRGNDNQPAAGCGLAITQPCKTISKGIARADDLSKPRVYVAGGVYARFNMKSGIEVKGRFNEEYNGTAFYSIVAGDTTGDPAAIVFSGVNNAKVTRFVLWTPNVTAGTTQAVLIKNASGAGGKITLDSVVAGQNDGPYNIYRGKGNQPAAIVVEGGSVVDLNDVSANSPQAVGPGSSTYGLRVANSTVTVSGGTYLASAGVAGSPTIRTLAPSQPPTPTRGGDGLDGRTAGTGYSGGGNGGRGGGSGLFGVGMSSGDPGTAGVSGHGSGGARGNGGSDGCFGGDAGTRGFPGAAGTEVHAAGGNGGKNTAVAVSGDTWSGHPGSVGSAGVTGAAGGGGGGGGGNCTTTPAGGGGAGGGKGTGGSPGTQVGSFGGGSFGIYAFKSTLLVSGASVNAGTGGAGGYGQNGGPGGHGGAGGHGAPDRLSNEGGGGGGGGAGGSGGGGSGGGEGGPSIAIYVRQAPVAPVLNPANAIPGTPGAGGLGGLGSGGGNGGEGGDSDGWDADGGPGGYTGNAGQAGDVGRAAGQLIQ